MADLRKVEVFVASPVDVKVERARVDAVVGRIAAEFEGIAEFPEPIRSRRNYYTADRTFQAQIPEPGRLRRGDRDLRCPARKSSSGGIP